MRGSHKKKVPPELENWLAQESEDWKPTYPFPGDIREHVVNALRDAQRGLCVYCGRQLHVDECPQGFHIEHFRPKRRFPDLQVDISNLYLSCGCSSYTQTCGGAKGGELDCNCLIEPKYPDCMDRFFFKLSGMAAARDDADHPARAMIELLKLNHDELVMDRETILEFVDNGQLDWSDFVNPRCRDVEDMAHVVGWHLGMTIPDWP